MLPSNAIGPDRLGDVLEISFTEILELRFDLAAHLAIGVVGQANSVRLSKALHARGDVHPVAMNIVILDDYVPDINADPKLEPLLLIGCCFSIHHTFLPNHSAVESVQYTSELDQQAVADELDYTAIVFGDDRFQHLVPQVSETPQCSGLILAHKARITDHIGGKNGGESAFQAFSPSDIRLSAMEEGIYAGWDTVE